MEKNKLCLFCCHSFLFSDSGEHAEKINNLLEAFKSFNYRSGQVDVFWNNVNFCEELKQIENSFGLSLCSDCETGLNDLIKLNEDMSLLENQVISLQKQILKGLHELGECQKRMKCQHEKMGKIIHKSDVSCLEKRFPAVNLSGKEEDTGNFAMKLRQWIVQDALQHKESELKGSISISPTKENKRQLTVKVEVEPEVDDDDDDHFDSNSFWEPEQELVIKPDPHEITNKERRKPKIKYEKKNIISSMTLRKRKISKSTNQILPKIPSPSTKTCLIKSQNSIKPCLKKSTKKSSQSLKKPAPKSPKKLTSEKVIDVKEASHFCELCPFKANKLPAFEQHLKEHEYPQTDTQFKCLECPSEFSTNQYFQFHQKLHQDIYKMYCDICSEFLPVLRLQDHIRSHFPPNSDDTTTIVAPKIIFCKNCSFCCTTTNAYLNHCRRHLVSNTARFPCSICSEEFNTSSKLIHHYPQAHKDTVETWPCDVGKCSRIFPSKDTLIGHKRLIHRLNAKVVPCADPNCDKMFSSVDSMKAHLGIHSGEKRFSCESCGEKYLHKEGLNSHRRRVHGAAKPNCKICGVEFFDPRTLKGHMALHENKGVPCEICGKTFGSKQAIKVHLWTHSEEMRWTCEKCGKGFKTRDGWKEHLAMHEDKKNWNCEYCGKGFVRRNNLRDHLRVHTGERPFICDACGKDFNQASALRIHKRKQHQ